MRKSKLDLLAEIEGCEDGIDLCLERGMDSVVPGICINDGCEHTAEVEPDQNRGFCEICKTGTVRSCLVLAGMI